MKKKLLLLWLTIFGISWLLIFSGLTYSDENHFEKISGCSNGLDSLSLIEFYNNTTVKWNTSQPYSLWDYITLDSCGRVISFIITPNLVSAGWGEDAIRYPEEKIEIYGSVPVSFFKNLRFLEKLNFTYIEGLELFIPDEINNMDSLKSINFSLSEASGTIPPTIGELQNLTSITLEENNFEGEIPIEIGNLKNLAGLNLSFNLFSGNIPKEIGDLEKLSTLQLNRNNFSGTIPKELGQLNKLSILWLNSNQLKGTIPKELGNLNNLWSFNLSDNQLSGTIPEELGSLTNLWTLDLGGNLLTGSLPLSFSKLENLGSLDLRNNNFSQHFFDAMPILDALGYLNLDSNFIAGNIPDNFQNFPNLGNLQISHNSLTGTIPEELVNSPIHLFFDNNYLDSLPPYTLSWHKIISVTNNRLTFDDIIPNLWLNEFYYKPQLAFSLDSTIVFHECDAPIINLEIDKSINDNTYTWYKNGELINISNANQLNLRDIYDYIEDYPGVYKCLVTNPRVQDLVLSSGEYSVELDLTELIPDTIQIEKNICIGNSLDTLGYAFDCSLPKLLIPIPDSITGCTTIYDIQLNCTNCQGKSEIPTTFTPNGDGFNETFIIPYLLSDSNSYKHNLLKIYDSRGILVYEVRDYLNDWQGRDLNGNELPVGTYYYNFEYGNQQVLRGVVTIIR